MGTHRICLYSKKKNSKTIINIYKTLFSKGHFFRVLFGEHLFVEISFGLNTNISVCIKERRTRFGCY